MRLRVLTGCLILGVTLVCPLRGDDSPPIREAPRPAKAAELGVGRLVPDIAATDVNGRKVRPSDFRRKRAVVIALTGTSCPLSLRYTPTLAKLEQTYRDENVAFIFVDPVGTDGVEDIRAAIKTHGLKGPYIRDTEQTFAGTLDAKSTTEVFLLDSARTLVYRGAVDDQYGFGYALDAPRKTYLVDALEALLAGRSPEIAATTSPGCELWLEKNEPETTTVTYHNRISRIVQQNCQECHRKDGLAPFSLETSEDVVAHAGMIRRVVERRLMPPWFAAPPEDGQQSPWANDRSLSSADKRDLLAWLESDRPLGNQADAPLPRKFSSEWVIGKPDAVFEIPQPIAVKATGQMPYKNVRAETDFNEDKWVQMVEIQPTDRAVVHHVLVFIVENQRGGRFDERSGFFAAYVPGNTFQKYPDGFAKKVPAGATLHFQLHYTPVGTATEDQTRIGLVFAKEPPQHIVRNAGIANHRISIPSGAANHPEHASLIVPTDVKLLTFLPHLHLRGKAFRYDLVTPNGESQTVLDVPRYDFNWQLQYRLAEPLDAPRGSKIEVTGWYDNSDGNPANPDPTETVRWGPQTDDEMLLGYVEYYVPGETVDAESSAGTGKNRANEVLRTTFQRVDKNNDGKVTADELQKDRLFQQLDKNGDGAVTLEEAEEVLKLRRN